MLVPVANQLGQYLNQVNPDFNVLVGTAGVLFGALTLSYKGGEVRSPLLATKYEEQEKIKEILMGAGIEIT